MIQKSIQKQPLTYSNSDVILNHMIFTITRVGWADRWFLNDGDDYAHLFKRRMVDSNCVGYYNTSSEAVNAVNKDFGGLHECLWEYVVIEGKNPGVYSFQEKFSPIWFKYVGGSAPWQWCVKPEEFEGLIGFSMSS